MSQGEEALGIKSTCWSSQHERSPGASGAGLLSPMAMSKRFAFFSDDPAKEPGSPPCDTPSSVLSHIQSNQKVSELHWLVSTVRCNDSITNHGSPTDSYPMEPSGASETQGKHVEFESLGRLNYVASGEYADVYTATQPFWGRSVAVKLMKEMHREDQRVLDDIAFGKLLLHNFV